jgi:cell division protein FtsI/penicillin-binding protein 2
LAEILGPINIPSETGRFFKFSPPSGEDIFLESTIDPDLQMEVVKWIRSSGAKKAALVALDPNTGRILAIAGRDESDEELNSALSASFPAASLFKMVTAAAAVEIAELNAGSTVAYDGAKHTLYKANLAKEPDKGRHLTTLSKSFAESINMVFGKLGVYSLSPEDLSSYAVRFGFNTSIDFELPLDASTFQLGDELGDTFHLAELASGFNRITKLSPVHGALMAASVVNGGNLYQPTIISEALDRNNNVIYRNNPEVLGRVFSHQTAGELSLLMEAAVTEGTGRKGFSDVGRHRVLSQLVVGGKSGSINDEEGSRVDWFVAYARHSNDFVEPLALAAVVLHDGRTMTSSQELVRRALISYYGPRLPEEGKPVLAEKQGSRS